MVALSELEGVLTGGLTDGYRPAEIETERLEQWSEPLRHFCR